MKNSFKTIKSAATATLVEKKSRFISYVSPVQTEEQAMDFIAQIKKKHWDASHNVYAYALQGDNISRHCDDGEPSGTAGAPTLAVINGLELVNIVVVTTRYFGGTLLGTGGLIRAYSKTAKLALEAAEIQTLTLCDVYQIIIPYELLSKIKSAASADSFTIGDILYDAQVTLTAYVQNPESFFRAINNCCGKNATIEKISSQFM